MEYLKKHWLIISIIILLLICIIMILIYFKNVSNNFSTTSDDWGNFGGYLGSITGVLAFAGVLYSIQQSNNIHTEDSERDTFFQLLELHTNKVNAVEFNGKRGAEAFKELADIANKNLNLLFMGKVIEQECANIDEDVLLDIYQNKQELFKLMKVVYEIYHNGCFYTSPLSNNIESTLGGIRNMKINVSNKQLKLNISERYNDSSILSYLMGTISSYNENKYEYANLVGDFLYKEYGHILGHYFRNMYYVMDTIDKFSDKKNYRELFRAQLSRYELALGLFNAVSSSSSDRMIHLLKEFKIFKDTYSNDITVLKVLLDDENSNGVTNQDKMLAITNEILDNWKA